MEVYTTLFCSSNFQGQAIEFLRHLQTIWVLALKTFLQPCYRRSTSAHESACCLQNPKNQKCFYNSPSVILLSSTWIKSRRSYISLRLILHNRHYYSPTFSPLKILWHHSTHSVQLVKQHPTICWTLRLILERYLCCLFLCSL
jgi:hypothetical protein